MIRHIDFEETTVIVELGAGDGVITQHILDHMRGDCRLYAFEVNPQFCKKLRSLNDARLVVVEDSAGKMDEYLSRHAVESVDHIVSAIPFVVVPEKEAYSIVENCRASLKIGGKFIQVHYSLLARKMYQTVFGNVAVGFVPLNIPPAFILVSVAS